MRTRSGCSIPPSIVSAWTGGSPSGQTPSSSARRSSGWCDSRTRSPRWWSKVGYRKKRSCSTRKCLPLSRIPPFLRVRSCSPSASARTVTAHSLKAIGMESGGGIRVQETAGPGHSLGGPAGRRGASLHVSRQLPNESRSCVELRSTQFPAGEALQNLDHRREVRVAEIAADTGRQDVAHRRRRGERRTCRLRLLQAQAHVLEHVLQLE